MPGLSRLCHKIWLLSFKQKMVCVALLYGSDGIGRIDICFQRVLGGTSTGFIFKMISTGASANSRNDEMVDTPVSVQGEAATILEVTESVLAQVQIAPVPDLEPRLNPY